ncbi:MAG: Tm-1-like ATP-binding domain-containing protein, partial [Clostridium sp.]|nr:Tm-1-like ATP-binding domain-containing protein [Clostridium sp.]
MKTIALISSLDTKEEEILYAKELIEKRGLFTFLIDLSTRRLENAHADLKAKEILGAAGIGEEQIRAMDKADCISAMENAAKTAVQTAYADGRFQGILCIGGGQNARM